MKISKLLYCCRIEDASDNYAVLPEFLNALGMDFSSYEDKEHGGAIHVVYAEAEAVGRANFQRLQEALPLWKECGVRVASPITFFTLKREDWSEVWKKYFHILHISEHLVIRPSWLKYTASPGEKVLTIDPGMSFGTGQHATTAYCLGVIDRLAGSPGVRSMLDAGCGSGILSIAAGLFGYEPIAAFDNDEDAVRIAQENALLNGFGPEKIRYFEGNAAIQQFSEPFDFVAANILSHLLIQFRRNIVSWVRPGGYLALAGILNEEFDAVSKAFTELGFKEVERSICREWTGGLFQKGGKK